MRSKTNDPPPAKPFIRWAGSKARIVTKLASMAPPSFERYIEPFVGSAALYFKLQPEKAILSDLNKELINSYHQVIRSPLKIANALSFIPRTSEQYKIFRSHSPAELDPLARAIRFIYLNRNCFNGLYRTNQKGEFNVPFAASRAGQTPSRQLLSAAAKLLRTSSIKSCDFENSLRQAERSDFIYLDPPFAVINKRIFKQYDPASFGYGDLERLIKALKELDQKGAKFLVSYAWNKDVTPLFRSWNIRRVRVARNIAGFATHRKGAYEMIATNY